LDNSYRTKLMGMDFILMLRETDMSRKIMRVKRILGFSEVNYMDEVK